MTANAFEENVMMSKQVGMNDHMSKPIDVKRFYDVIYNYLVGGCR
jgi:CheY-like chemotaxis protein